MRLTRRRSEARASYVAVVADRWLWVAAPEPLDVALDGVDLPAVVDDEQPGHVGVRLDLAALPSREGRWAVLAGRSPLLGPPPAPSGPGTTHALERDDHDRLHVVRREHPAGPTLRSLRLVGETVEIRIDGADGATLALVGDPTRRGSPRLIRPCEPASGAIQAGTTPPPDCWTLAPSHLVDVAPGAVLRVEAGGRPVLRRGNTLADPGAGALLPAVHPIGAAQPVARLRWAPDATLVIRMTTL